MRNCWIDYLLKLTSQSNIIRATNNNRGQWNSQAAFLYSNELIADIQILK